MKKLLLVLLIVPFLFGCTIQRKPVDDMFPQMTYLEVYNGGSMIASYEGRVEIKMGSMKNKNFYGEDFILEVYEIYVDGHYVETFIDSEAMAFRFKVY